MAKKVAYSSMLVALAMIFSYVELLIPVSFGIPGIKLGLANLVILLGLFFMSSKQVFLILITRIVLSGFLFGNLSSIIYSLAGGVLSFCVMLAMKRVKGISMLGLSMAGGVCHNIGQLLIATVVVQNLHILYYSPALLFSGVLSGLLIGLLGQNIKKYLGSA